MKLQKPLIPLYRTKYFTTILFLIACFQLKTQAQCLSIPPSLLQNKEYFAEIGKIKPKDDSLFVPIVVMDPKRKPDSLTYTLSVYTKGAGKLEPVISDSFLYLHDYFINEGTITLLGNRLSSDSVDNQLLTAHHFGHYQYEKRAGGFTLKKFTPLFHEHYSFFDALGFVGVIDSSNAQHYYKSATGDSLAIPLPSSSIKKLFPFNSNRAIVADQNNLFHLFYYDGSGSLQQEVSNASYIKVNTNSTVFVRYPDGSIQLIKVKETFPYAQLVKKEYRSGHNFIDLSKHALVRNNTNWYAVDQDLKETPLPIDNTVELPLPKLFIKNSTTAYFFNISQANTNNTYLLLDLQNTSAITIDTITNKHSLIPYLYLDRDRFVLMRPSATELAFVPYVNLREQPIIRSVPGNFLDMTVIPIETSKTGTVIIYKKDNRSRADLIIKYGQNLGDISSKMYNELFDKWWTSQNNRFLITSKRKPNQLVETYGYDLSSLVDPDTSVPKSVGGATAKLIHMFFVDPCDPCTFYYKVDGYNAGRSIEMFKRDCKNIVKLAAARTSNNKSKNSGKKSR